MKGQISIAEYLFKQNQPQPVVIKGLCDDAYCPECGAELDELKILDCERCPECRIKLDWTPWHRNNDK